MSKNLKKYNFSSVGELEEPLKDSPDELLYRSPIGISTPLRFSTSGNNTFQMNSDLLKQIRDNFKNMLATNHGERLVYHDFGANLYPLVFELGNEEIDFVALKQIKETTEKYMPYVSLETFEPMNLGNDDYGNAVVKVIVSFLVPKLSQKEQFVEVYFKYGG
jgi:phage baseplate assembly protein W